MSLESDARCLFVCLFFLFASVSFLGEFIRENKGNWTVGDKCLLYSEKTEWLKVHEMG